MIARQKRRSHRRMQPVRSSHVLQDAWRVWFTRRVPHVMSLHSARIGVLSISFAGLIAASAAAQTPDPSVNSSVTDVVDGQVLQNLPLADDLFSALETMHAAVITDRFSPGGLSVAESARVGAYMNSWTQTGFRIGDVDVTSPDGGAPLLVPPLLFWQRIGVTTGGTPADSSTPGLLISLEPKRPSATWTGTINGFESPSPFAALPTGGAPAVALPNGWMQSGAEASGPLVRDRLGVVLSAAWSRSSQFDRGRTIPGDAGTVSVLSHLLFTPDTQNELSTVAWIQKARYPSNGRIPYSQPGSSDRDTAVHVQSSWDRHVGPRAAWRAFGGFTMRSRNAAAAAIEPATIERLLDGPVPTLVEAAGGTQRRWTLGLRFNGTRSSWGHTQSVQAGLEAGGAQANEAPSYPSAIRELVDGLPARLWKYSTPSEAHRSETTLAGFVGDRVVVSRRLTVDAALRFDGVSGSARGAAQGVAWRTWLPRIGGTWALSDVAHLGAFANYGRTADRLTIGTLAYGDPAAPVADVYRWNGTEVGPLVARVGPGLGGDTTLTTIDPHLERPITEEIDLGLESAALRSTRLRLTGIVKRESHALAVLNTGVPTSSYAAFGIPDPGGSFDDPRDDQILPVYDRLPSSFGRDRYRLANSPDAAATFGGLALSAQTSTNRLFLFASGAIGHAHAEPGNRGFRANENDLGVLGELFTNPNATTHPHGEPFTSRAKMVKISGVYQFPRSVRLGVIARYQDGQPFARMVIVPGLNQGPEAVRAIFNGRSRFTYTGTLDVRVQKEFSRKGRRIAVVVDIYNLPNMRKEVEEYVVTGSRFREETLVQPPRTAVIGLRFSM